MLQPIGVILHLITDIEFLLRPELGEHIFLFYPGTQPLLVPGDHALGNIPFHCRQIAVLEVDGPIHFQPFAVPVNLAFSGIKIHLINAQIVHTEGMEHIVAPLLKLTEQVAAFQGGNNEVCRRLEHI